MNTLGPVIGAWFKDLQTGARFEVVAVDPASQTVETQHIDGEVSEYEASYVGNRALDSTSDTYAYQQGYATITPLKFDWTAYDMLSEVEAWGLTLD